MSFHHYRGFCVLALLLGVVGSAGGAGRAAETELKLDTSLDSAVSSLLSGRRGRITGARVVDATPQALVLKVTYSGLTADGLTLTARALNRRRVPLPEIKEGRTQLTARDGEAEVRLEAGAVGGIRREGEGIEQRYLLIEIGAGRGRPDCVQVYRHTHDWAGGAGGAGGGGGASPGRLVNVTAQPVGESLKLPAQQPRAQFTAPLILQRAPVERAGLTVRDHRVPDPRVRDHRTERVPYIPRPGIRPGTRPRPGVIKPPPGIVVGLPEDVTRNKGKGPATALPLSQIQSDVNVERDEILSLQVFEDGNPESGFYYYLPRSFHLNWDEASGYALSMLYGAAANEMNPNTVYVSAEVTGDISSAEIALAEKLARRDFQSRYPNRTFGGLKEFPISGMKPELNAEAFGIPKDKLVVTPAVDLSGAIVLSFTTDPVTKENLQAYLTEGRGLTGTVTMLSDASTDAGKIPTVVPLVIKLADRRSFGRSAFTRGAPFRNLSPYPVKLNYLHVLQEARVFSYTLGDAAVLSGGSAQIDAGRMPQWLDGAADRMWVEYTVTGDPAAHRKVVEQLTGGVSNVAQTEVTFRTLTPLADSGAALIQVTIASRYLEPKGQMEKVVTLELTKDSETFRLKPVYLVNRQAEEEKPDDPLIRYRLTVVKPDGTSKEGKEWIASSKRTIFIGAAQVKPILEGN